jgi:hypothetical protein
MSSCRPGLALAATVVLLVIGAPAHADTCNLRAKLKIIGQKESRLLECQSKVAATANSLGLGACESKAAGKFFAAIVKTGTCQMPGIPTPCEAIVECCETVPDLCASSVAGAFIDIFPNKCEAVKRKAAGHLASGELACYAKATAKALPVDARCISKATAKFSAVMTKAGTCPDGGSPQTFVEDNCVRPAFATNAAGVVTEACPAPTTTSTTTTTVTTTPPRQTCGAYPTCGGSCPTGQTCVSIAQQCLCFDDGGCTASYPACSGTCSSGGQCLSFNTSLGSFCGCVGAGCSCGGSCADPQYGCIDSGTRFGCVCFSAQ